jgi:hypothetical protein
MSSSSVTKRFGGQRIRASQKRHREKVELEETRVIVRQFVLIILVNQLIK